ncbi:MAG: hypothetical protein LH477_13970 [Nocardioides sp.]|nr:hypothetical protein [Nocardioides sp.]
MHQSISGLLMVPLTLLLTRERERDERGDVPGWVMVTLMTAMVVTALIPVVRTQLMDLLNAAFAMVKSG